MTHSFPTRRSSYLFPIPVSQDEDTITVIFKQFGVSLAFTPTLVGRSRISMRVRPEVSQLSTAVQVVAGGLSIPSLTTRRAETTVELASGQSFAIEIGRTSCRERG